jgi:hypothetical protein
MIRNIAIGRRVWHPLHGKGTVTGKWDDAVTILFDKGKQLVFPLEHLLLFNTDE